MKELAIIILIIIISPILGEPFIEMNLVIVDKAKLDSALRNSGKLAISTSVIDENRSNVDSTIDKLTFVNKFSDSFETALNLERKGTLNENYAEFRALDEELNDFKVTYNWDEDIKYELNGDEIKKNTCEIIIESPYKFKTKYLKIAGENFPDLNDFKLTANKTFVVKVAN